MKYVSKIIEKDWGNKMEQKLLLIMCWGEIMNKQSKKILKTISIIIGIATIILLLYGIYKVYYPWIH